MGLTDIYSAPHLGRDREKTEQEQTPPGHLVHQENSWWLRVLTGQRCQASDKKLNEKGKSKKKQHSQHIRHPPWSLSVITHA